MIHAAVARRYAKALLSAVAEMNRPAQGAEQVALDLEAIAATVGRFNELELLLLNPAVEADDKAAVLMEIGVRRGMGSVTQRFIRVLAERERLDHLQAVAEAFRALANEQEGVINAEITSPQELDDNDIAALRAKLGEATGQQVRLTIKTDPELLGGLVTRIGDVIYDGSLRYQLDRLRGQMIEG